MTNKINLNLGLEFKIREFKEFDKLNPSRTYLLYARRVQTTKGSMNFVLIKNNEVFITSQEDVRLVELREDITSGYFIDVTDIAPLFFVENHETENIREDSKGRVWTEYTNTSIGVKILEDLKRDLEESCMEKAAN